MNEMTKRVFDTVDTLADQYLSVLIDACNIESKSDDKDGVDRVGAYFAALAESLGFSLKKEEQERSGNVYAFTYNPTGEKRQICLSGHMDTVFPRGSFGYPTTRVEGDYVYGPGVCDCKGNIALAFLVMDALKTCGYRERPIKLILQSDEEINSSLSDGKTLEFMVAEAKGSAAFLNVESIGIDRCLSVGRKGIIAHRVTVMGKKAHAGWCTQGVSALKEAAHKIIAFEEDNDGNGITFNCGMLQGGTATNIVPDRCEMLVEYRFKNMAQKKEADEKFTRILSHAFVEGTTATAELLSHRLPMERDEKNQKLADTINQICESVGIAPFGTKETAGGADSAYPSLAGIPTVDSIGIEGGNFHTQSEWARISSMAEMAKTIAAVIINFPE